MSISGKALKTALLALGVAGASPAFAASDDAAIQARLARLEAQNAALIQYLAKHSDDPAAAALIAALQSPTPSAAAPAAVPAPAPDAAPADAPQSAAASAAYAPAKDAIHGLVGTSSTYSANMLNHTEWTNTKALLLLQSAALGDLPARVTIGGDVVALGDWQYSNRASKFGWLMRQPTANNQVGNHVSELAISSVQMNLTARVTPAITAYAELLYNPETSFGAGSNTALTRNLVSVTRAFVTFGNLNRLPVYAAIGKIDVPFGQNDSVSPYSNSTSWHAFGGLANGAEIGYFAHGLSLRAMAIEGGAQFRAVNSMVDGTSVPSLVNNYAFDANYTYNFAGGLAKIGASYEHGSDYCSGFPIVHFEQCVINNPAIAAYGKLAYGRLTLMGDFAKTTKGWLGTAPTTLAGYAANPYAGMNPTQVTVYTAGGRYNAPLLTNGIDVSFEFSKFITGPVGTPWHRQNQLVGGLAHHFTPSVKIFGEAIRTMGYAPLNFLTGGNGGGACGASTCPANSPVPYYASWTDADARSTIGVVGVEAAF